MKKRVNEIIEKVLSPDYKLPLESKFTQKISGTIMGYMSWEAGKYYPFLYELMKEFQPDTVVELGNREGASTIMIYAGLKPDARFVTVDQKRHLAFVPDFILNDSDKVKFLFGNDIDGAIVNQIADQSVDILFIDTLHKSSHLMAELKAYEPKLKDEALIILDDIDWPGMIEGWNQIQHDKENHTKLHGSGFGIVYFRRNSND